MSNLSWLNPTPHAIAVYASQPLSPVGHATLATKRTLLLTWAGLAPAGSRQLCLAHLLDHLVGGGEQVRGDCEPDRFGGLEVNDQVVLGRRLNWKVCWPCALEHAIDVVGRASELV